MSRPSENAAYVAISNIQFQIMGTMHNLNVLVSNYGALMVFESSDAPVGIDQYVGRPIEICCDGIDVQGFFVKEIQSESAHYSIQFDADWAAKKHLDQLIRQKGAKMPPRRKFPRLDARTDIVTARPQYALVTKDNESVFYSIVNFTIGGLLIESFGNASESLEIGQHVEFNIHISDGQQISGFAGEAVRMKKIESDEILGEQCVQYGIRLSHTDKVSYESYRKVIYDYCMAVNENAA